MKKIITLVFLLASLMSFSQHITYDKGKYYVRGEQISTRELLIIKKATAPINII